MYRRLTKNLEKIAHGSTFDLHKHVATSGYESICLTFLEEVMEEKFSAEEAEE